jgi:AcrR family transcriptional regulator
LVNVRNQDIAKKTGISLSNFNYHFSTKQDLVLEVFDYIGKELEEKVYGDRVLIHKGKGTDIIKSYFEFEMNFRFFYLDTFNILQTYPQLQAGMQARIEESLQIIKNLNYISIGMGELKPEPVDMPGLYDRLAEQIWINNHFLFAQLKIRGIENINVKMGLESVYYIVYPYLTDKGKQMYRRYFLKK